MSVKKSAGELLREARLRAGLSQTELARRAGVAQSVISTYEADKREPGLHTLDKLISATGSELSIGLIPGTPTTEHHTGRLGAMLRQKRLDIIAMAADRGVTNIRIFGSVARGEDTVNSDVDLLVTVGDGVGLFALLGLQSDLEDLLGTKVDLVPDEGIKPRLQEKIFSEAIAL